MAVEKTKTNQRKTCKEQNPDYFEREREMGLQKRLILVGIGMLWLCYNTVVARNIPNTRVKLTLCSSEVYFNGDPFAISLDYVISELESATPKYAGYDYSNISPFPNAFAFGHANCNSNLTSTDCATCLAAAKIAMLSDCDTRIGARSALVDCSIRYEQYPF